MTSPPLERTIRTDADLFALWETLMGPGGFGQRSLWLGFLDGANRTLPLLVPIDGIPSEPDPPMIASLGRIVADLVADGPAESAVVLLSRPGPTRMTAQDRRWARAVSDALRPDFDRWPIHLATTDTIQVFAPDDLVDAAAAS